MSVTKGIAEMPLNALRACAEKLRLLWKPSIRLIGRPRYHLCENGDLERREGSLVYVMVRQQGDPALRGRAT